MHLLLCAATAFEIQPTIERLESSAVSVLITGVGLAASTYSITRAVLHHKPGLIIQAGVAGTFDASLALGTVVAIRNDRIGDLGVEENGRFRSIVDLKLLQPDEFPWREGRLFNDHDILKQVELPVVDAVTVNEISTADKKMDHYRTGLGVQVESMEGAALHYVALSEKIPFIQIRSVSNIAGERNKDNWKMGLAIANLNAQLNRILTKYLNR
jgi:futalosine hydrolase